MVGPLTGIVLPKGWLDDSGSIKIGRFMYGLNRHPNHYNLTTYALYLNPNIAF